MDASNKMDTKLLRFTLLSLLTTILPACHAVARVTVKDLIEESGINIWVDDSRYTSYTYRQNRNIADWGISTAQDISAQLRYNEEKYAEQNDMLRKRLDMIDRIQIDGKPVLWYIHDRRGKEITSAYFEPWSLPAYKIDTFMVSDKPMRIKEIATLIDKDIPVQYTGYQQYYWGNNFLSHFYFNKRKKYYLVELVLTTND